MSRFSSIVGIRVVVLVVAVWLIGFLGRRQGERALAWVVPAGTVALNTASTGTTQGWRARRGRARGALTALRQDAIVTGEEPRDVRAFGRATAPLNPPLSTPLMRGNEEASSGGLKETHQSRVTTRRQPDKQPRDTAITPFISFSFGAALHLPCFANRRAGSYARYSVIPARYAVKPTRRAVMTAFVCLLGPARLGCDGHAAP